MLVYVCVFFVDDTEGVSRIWHESERNIAKSEISVGIHAIMLLMSSLNRTEFPLLALSSLKEVT